MLSKLVQVRLIKDLAIDLLKIAAASLVMVLTIYIARPIVSQMPLTEKGEVAVSVLVIIPLAVAIYFTVLWLIKFREMGQLQNLLGRFINRNRSTTK